MASGREKFLARRVTIRLACFFFNPCHTTLFSGTPSRRENLSLYPPVDTDPTNSTITVTVAITTTTLLLCPLHPSEYHSANVDLHPFSVSSGETTCPPDETFRMFATSTSRLVRPRFFDLSRSREPARGTLTSLPTRFAHRLQLIVVETVLSDGTF